MGASTTIDGDESQGMHGSHESVSASTELERFALRVYSADGVPDACLLLQGSAGLDVDLLLFAARVGVGGSILTPAHLVEARTRVGQWNSEVVRPLRALRRRLKAGPPPAPDERTASLRSDVQMLETRAELIELAQLSALAERVDAAPATGDAVGRAAANMGLVVTTAADRQPSAEEIAAVFLVAEAAALVHRTPEVTL